jgi:hypothetical protein
VLFFPAKREEGKDEGVSEGSEVKEREFRYSCI